MKLRFFCVEDFKHKEHIHKGLGVFVLNEITSINQDYIIN